MFGNGVPERKLALMLLASIGAIFSVCGWTSSAKAAPECWRSSFTEKVYTPEALEYLASSMQELVLKPQSQPNVRFVVNTKFTRVPCPPRPQQAIGSDRLFLTEGMMETPKTWAFRPGIKPNSDAYWSRSLFGAYAGVSGIGSFNTLGQQERSKLTDAVTNDFQNASQAMGLSLNGGVLFSPWNNNILIGPSASIDIFKQDTIHNFPPGQFFLGQTINAIGTLNEQVGVVAKPGLFIFGELGAAFVNLDQKLNFSGPVTSVNQTVTGLNLGFGVDYKPPGWQIGGNPISLVGQYNHIFLPGATFDNSGSPGFTYRNSNEINEIKFGARLNFYGG